MFSNVFERFFLAYFAQALQINPPSPAFTPKTNIPPKNNLKKSQFPPKSKIFPLIFPSFFFLASPF
jgi:hypothetical protein